jgi:ArsR family transcriptional regulator
MAGKTMAEEILEVLGNESRRRILNLLSKKPCYVSEISYSLKMSPKVVLDHLEKLENIGIVRCYEEGRRRYYNINSNLRIEISITPHRFFASTIKGEPELEFDKLMKHFENAFKPSTGSMVDLFRALRDVEEIEKCFSEMLGAVSRRFNDMFEELLDEIEKEIDDEVERIVMLAITKGADTPLKISESFGIPYNDVLKALKSLESKNLVEKEEGDEIYWRIKC